MAPDVWGRPASTSVGAAVVLPGNQPPVPAENRVRCDDAGDLRQNPPAEFLASHRESTALGVGQAKWTWATLLPEDPILLPEIIDHVFLVVVHPASGREYEEAQSVGHSLRLLGKQPLAPTWFRRFANLGRFVAPYDVEQYYTRSQRLLVEETVIQQRLSRSWAFEGFARRLEYELRVEWDPSSTEEPARVVRELVRASGPPLGPPDQEDCMDPRAISPEPLAFLLPDRRNAFSFEVAGSTRVDGREAVMLDYRVVARGQPTAEWTGKCAWVDLSGPTRGRVWADANTFEILCFDEHLVGLVDIPRPRDRSAYGPRFFTFERADSSIRYQRVTFENPDETLMLPARIESTTIFGTPVFRGCAPHRPTPTTAGSSPIRGSSRSLISCLHPSWFSVREQPRPLCCTIRARCDVAHALDLMRQPGPPRAPERDQGPNR